MAERESFYTALGRLSAIITIIPASMAAGWVFGHYVVDRYLKITPWGGVAFILIGAAAGFYEILQILAPNRQKRDDPPPNDPS